ncbi:MAG: NAD(P)-dependent oxidoreductase [candidate division KSB1 bacterium]|nr:NAD(P)-dependent oxidoreductase [candidate division KSB1 bacterium]
MKILFTGSSSFTGYWFIQELAKAGHEILAIFRKGREEYADIRRERVERAIQYCTPVFNCEFGSEKFIDLILSESQWDVLCHHAADVTNYKSIDFDVHSAVAQNTKNIRKILEALEKRNCSCIVATGSVFEQDEGAGEKPLRAFSPYGLSKGLTWQVLKFYSDLAGMTIGKFVIPNPFGPFEEPRFTTYLIKNWFAGHTPSVNTPLYVRDNIHVTLLAKAYKTFVADLFENQSPEKLNPSGYVETQGAFAKRFAGEISQRLDISCELVLHDQKEFSEPKIRINTDVLNPDEFGWDEKKAWDELAAYYMERFSTS